MLIPELSDTDLALLFRVAVSNEHKSPSAVASETQKQLAEAVVAELVRRIFR